jgi:hypothetical protein
VSARELTGHERELAREYIQAADAIKAWGEVRTKARDQLAASLGEEVGTVDGAVAVTVSRTTPSSFNLTRFAKDHPALVTAYTEPASTPRVTLHPHKGIPW